MYGVSSETNDSFVVNQFRQTRCPSEKIRTMFNQLGGCIPLTEAQMRSLLSNYLRIGLFQNFGDEQERQKAALLFEQVCAKWVDRFNVAYWTDAQLKERNRERQKNGLSTLPTPDFLLHEEVHYRGFPVRWVECKNYYGTSERTVKNRLGFLKTAKKYYDAYGSGVIIFRHGFNKDLDIPEGVKFLDYSLLC